VGLSAVHGQAESGCSSCCRSYRNLCGFADDNCVGSIASRKRVESAHPTGLLVGDADNGEVAEWFSGDRFRACNTEQERSEGPLGVDAAASVDPPVD
jgi:hypothetical protein